jgi:hypothetical protein
VRAGSKERVSCTFPGNETIPVTKSFHYRSEEKDTALIKSTREEMYYDGVLKY